MSLKKSAVAWLVSAALASSLVLTPSEARADAGDTLDGLPFMVFAAAFTTLIIVYAVNNPNTSSSSDSSTTADTTTTASLRNAGGPMRPAPILGFSGHF